MHCSLRGVLSGTMKPFSYSFLRVPVVWLISEPIVYLSSSYADNNLHKNSTPYHPLASFGKNILSHNPGTHSPPPIGSGAPKTDGFKLILGVTQAYFISSLSINLLNVKVNNVT